MTLEIRVVDTISVAENFEEAMNHLIEQIKTWYESSESTPLTITLTKITDRGPPALGINVSDEIETNTGLA